MFHFRHTKLPQHILDFIYFFDAPIRGLSTRRIFGRHFAATIAQIDHA
jgi:hypothetical protein